MTRKPQLLVLSALPAAGKTTEALRWIAEDPEHRRRINWDERRLSLYGPNWKFNRKEEDQMQDGSFEYCRGCFEAGLSVVVDNTNLTDKPRNKWRRIAEEFGVEYVQQEIDTPVAECVKRDLKREKRVGRAVIERMALFHGFIDWTDRNVYPMQKFVVVDIDGTLSDPSHRLHHIKQEMRTDTNVMYPNWRPRWDLFHAEVDADPPKSIIIELVKILAHHYHILIVSGRSPEHGCGIKTEDWLSKHLEIPAPNRYVAEMKLPPLHYYTHLFMRQSGDYKPDFEHKQEILDLLPKDRIAFVLDDRQQVVDMWRKNGLTCLQVANGAF